MICVAGFGERGPFCPPIREWPRKRPILNMVKVIRLSQKILIV